MQELVVNACYGRGIYVRPCWGIDGRIDGGIDGGGFGQDDGRVDNWVNNLILI